ncbi:MAG: hypothetical protein K5840_01255 [Eubacterium sp.]|nr:hypothetical protein [Eubacterium sp.]
MEYNMYGVIDIGSNTVRFLVYRYDGGRIDKVLSKKYVVGLISYVNQDGALSPEGIQELVDAMEEISLFHRFINLKDFFVFATASLRGIKNTQEVLDAVKKATGYNIDVLSGEQEASLAFSGVMSENGGNAGVVADIGGGSTEVVCFRNGEMLSVDSVRMGTLTLYNSCVAGVLPDDDEMERITQIIRQNLSGVKFPDGFKGSNAYWVGGTGRAVLKIVREAGGDYSKGDRYDAKCLRELIDFYKNDRHDCEKLLVKFVPDRLHTFLPGVLVFSEVVRIFDVSEIITSVGGVREGYLIHKVG